MISFSFCAPLDFVDVRKGSPKHQKFDVSKSLHQGCDCEDEMDDLGKKRLLD